MWLLVEVCSLTEIPAILLVHPTILLVFLLLYPVISSCASRAGKLKVSNCVGYIFVFLSCKTVKGGKLFQCRVIVAVGEEHQDVRRGMRRNSKV